MSISTMFNQRSVPVSILQMMVSMLSDSVGILVPSTHGAPACTSGLTQTHLCGRQMVAMPESLNVIGSSRAGCSMMITARRQGELIGSVLGRHRCNNIP